jgi:hypothetical protein
MATTAMPETVRVGPFVYEVVTEPGPFLNDDNPGALCGEANHNDCRIRVMRRNPDQMFVTLWHEILHAADQLAETNLPEETVGRLAPIVAMVLLDNGYAVREAPDG